MFRRSCAALGIALSTSILLGGPGLAAVPQATARTVTGFSDPSDVSVRGIDSTRSISLSLRLKAGNPHDDEQPIQIAGRTLQAERIEGIDLTTAAGWKRANDISVNQARKMERKVIARGTTTEEGVVHMSGLSVGLYLVTEVVPPSADEETFVLVPFLITLPTGSFDGTEWDYDVEIDAKSEPNPDHTGGFDPPPTLPDFPDSPPATSVTTPRTPPGVPPVVPPGKPARPSQPAAATTVPPSKPVQPEQSGDKRPFLAQTGANVLGVVLIGVGLLLGGLWLRRRR